MADALFRAEQSPAVLTGRLPLPAGTGLRLAPCTIKTANQVVECWHRHSEPISQKVLCAVRCVLDAETVGVAILGLPVSRVLDDGLAVEVRRVCVREGAPTNACSMLYGAVCRAGAALGYADAYTYTTVEEEATSVRAAGFVEDGYRAAANWDTPSRPRDAAHHEEIGRVRWYRVLVRGRRIVDR